MSRSQRELRTSRARRLDALFAERVLGYGVHLQGYPDFLSGGTVECECLVIDGKKTSAGLPHYTRSLDAAWEGSKALGACCRDIHCDHDYAYRVTVYLQTDHKDEYRAQSEAHPAEALVLACLRSVGVAEEELG